MAIITKGMGAIMKLKKSRKVSDLKKAGKVPIKRKTIDKFGREKTNIDYVGGPLKGFSYKPKMPRKRGQGKLFGEKFEKSKNKDPNVLPGQLKFKFKGEDRVNPEKRLKTAIKRAEVK
tara:strand:- start:60 stop:413 length:354 start_codon:yes stop_codon:yes gene_type:complete